MKLFSEEFNNVKEVIAVGDGADVWNFEIAEIVNKNIQASEGMNSVTEAQAKADGYTVVKTLEELQTALNNNEKIGITGTVFHKSAEEIEKILEVCRKNGIEYSDRHIKYFPDDLLNFKEYNQFY